MKRLRQFAITAIALVLGGSFLAFQSTRHSAELELMLQDKQAGFRDIPINEYKEDLKELPSDTKKFTRVKVDAKTKVSSEKTYLRIPQ